MINILDSSIFNKISAGEVVERPANVVKELVENSIDAHSKNIVIEIIEGGIDYIMVRDDGIGMDKDDLKKSMLPHATSKISCVDDLSKIGTLGFRGEALASISAVANVEITSKQVDNVAYKIISMDMQISEPMECGGNDGTTIVVTDLFKNIPVRKKFLKKPKYEESQVTNYVEKLILANPNIAIKYIVNGKIIYNSTGKNLKEAIYIIYGKDILDNLVELNCTNDGKTLSGYISKPTFSKSTRSYQTLICNGRYIQSGEISNIVSNAYINYMMKGQFPFYVLNLTISNEEIDVNVHPNKLEVRFQNQHSIYELFYSTINKSVIENSKGVAAINGYENIKLKKRELESKDNLHTMEDIKVLDEIYNDIQNIPNKPHSNIKSESVYDDKKKKYIYKDDIFGYDDNKKENNLSKINNKFKCNIPQNEDLSDNTTIKPMQYHSFMTDNKDFNIPTSTIEDLDNKNNDNDVVKDIKKEKVLEDIKNIKNYKLFKNENTENSLNNVENLLSKNIKEVNNKEKNTQNKIIECENVENDVESVENNGITESQQLTMLDDEPLKIVGVCFETYILVEKGEDIYIIDQHAGHERLLYDELTEMVNNKKLDIQPLLIPYSFSVDTSEINFIEENMGTLEELGFTIEQIGEKTFSISTVPFLLANIDIKKFINELLNERPAILKLKSSDLIKEKLKSMSCRKAIKAGYQMNEKEIELLIKITKERNTTLMCPHGRPSVIKFTKYDFEKWFKRAV